MHSDNAGKERRNGTAEHSGGIVADRRGPYALYVKDDGHDYLQLWDDFRNGGVQVLDTLKHCRKTEVYLVRSGERDLIVKIDRKQPKGLESRLWHRLRGPMHSRNMRKVNRAVLNGCKITADIYLVAEKIEKGLCSEAWIIQEYIRGRTMQELADSPERVEFYKDAVVEAMLALHSQGLVLSDLGFRNILLTEQGIKFIDLSWNGPFWSGEAQDIVRMGYEFGARMPLTSLKQRLAVGYIRLKYKLQDLVRSPEKAKDRQRRYKRDSSS